MNRKDLDLILKEGEGYKIEFKEGVSDIDKDLVAFANSSEGKILLGITDGNREGTDVIDRKEISGSLFEIVTQAMDFIKLYSKVAYRFTGKPQRESIYEYPFKATREAVIDSVMHKDYFEHGHNNILRFLPDRIKIENFWTKPPHFKLGETVFRRNTTIVDLLARIHFGEKIGTGMQRMKDHCRLENAPYPAIQFNENYFYVTFKQSKEYLKLIARARTEDLLLNPRQRKAISFMRKKSRLTLKDYLYLCPEVNRRTLTRDLDSLLKLKLIVRKGKGKRDLHYVLS